MSADTAKLAKAMHFAALKHANQRRKGHRDEPYVNHLAEVGAILARHVPGDVNVIIAGILHDTLEDTQTTHAELEAEFGRDVADLVREVTDDKSLPSEERKRRQITETPHKSARARMIKLADKTSNLRSLAEDPPKTWDPARKRRYADWAEEVVRGCRGLQPGLEAEFDRQLAVTRRGLADAGPKPPI
jgi:(p)ppGpp synthase/HD superfamily hydrolase